MKKMVTFVTAASLLMGSMAMPVYGATFADINTVTWDGFKPFLEQAAELKLMNGYDEGGKKLCKPRNNVTYCEAVQLMYSIMKVYTKQDVSDATVTKWKPIMGAYNIPDWAYKATAYSLENAILTTTDLNNLQGNANKINTKAATREDVGVIFGKALDRVQGYDTKAGAALSYKDKAQISAAAVPYLELLYRANLMVGDTDNKFNPKANISRAEMAVLSVKSYNNLAENKAPEVTTSGAAAGTVATSMVMQNGDLFISIKTAAGDGLSLFGTKGKVTAKYDGEKIDFSDIGEGDTVKVSYEGTTLTAIEVTYSKAGLEKTTKVTYELADLTDKKIYVKDGSKEKEYRLDDDADVELAGRNSSVSKLQKAMEEANYDVTLTLDKDEYVLDIVAYLNDNNPLEGYVYDVMDDEITITAGTKKYTYPLAEEVEISYDGKSVKFSKFENEFDEYNYEISLVLNKDYEVDGIEILSMEDEYNGTLTSLGTKKIRFMAGGTEYEYNLASNVTVKVDGKKSTLKALGDSFRADVAYTVSVDIDRDDKVTEIIAETKFGDNNKGTLKEISASKVTVTADDKHYVYDLASEVNVTINGKAKTLDTLISASGEQSFDVEVKFDNTGKVKEITAQMTEVKEGILRDMVREEYITIRRAEINIDLYLASDVDVTLDGDDVTLAELNDEIDLAGDDSFLYVELKYDRNDKVDEITAYWVDAEGELKAVYEDDDEIKVGSKTYTVARNAEIVYKLGTSVDAEDYDDADDYYDDLDGLEDFLDDCEKADDICMVSLTLSQGEVTFIKVIAK
ncbi:MAG: S-layer homology domain-containing protein [Anaerotignum sp.]|nr:S-layer homology domain-containing protein [Anaerotignum sp.]